MEPGLGARPAQWPHHAPRANPTMEPVVSATYDDRQLSARPSGTTTAMSPGRRPRNRAPMHSVDVLLGGKSGWPALTVRPHPRAPPTRRLRGAGCARARLRVRARARRRHTRAANSPAPMPGSRARAALGSARARLRARAPRRPAPALARRARSRTGRAGRPPAHAGEPHAPMRKRARPRALARVRGERGRAPGLPGAARRRGLRARPSARARPARARTRARACTPACSRVRPPGRLHGARAGAVLACARAPPCAARARIRAAHS